MTDSRPGIISTGWCMLKRSKKPSDASRREKQLKGWRREKKKTLILTRNPTREDLAVSMLGLPPAPRHEWEERGRR